jgi:DNA-directed RNA polymerase subunit beta'
MPFINGLLKKKGLTQLVQYCYLRFGLQTTVRCSTRSRTSASSTPRAPASRSASTTWWCRRRRPAGEGRREGRHGGPAAVPDGAITHGERYNKIIEIWSKVTEKSPTRCSAAWNATTSRPRPQPDLHHGRLRRPRLQAADPPALRHARPDGQAVRRDHRDAHHGQLPRRPERAAVLHLDARRAQGSGRYGAEDRRLGLPDPPPGGRGAGRHRHRDDCGTTDGIFVEPIVESGEIIEPLRDRIVGRVALETSPTTKATRSSASNQEITEELAAQIQAAGIERVKIRSVLTCESKRGVCRCATAATWRPGRLVERGEAVGVIAAQSIGEPGTQLTMRTFHIGGAATRVRAVTQDAKSDGFAKFIEHQDRAQQGQGRTGRHEPQRHRRGRGRQGPREGALPGGLRRQILVSRTARRQAQTRSCSSGIPTPSRSSPSSAARSTSATCRKASPAGAGGRSHRHVAVGRHRLARREAQPRRSSDPDGGTRPTRSAT